METYLVKPIHLIIRKPSFQISLILFFIILLLFWIYFPPSLKAELVWDDTQLFSEYELLNTRDWFKNSFLVPYLSAYYRPIPLLSMIWNGYFGADAFVLVTHITNLSIFIICLILATHLVWRVAEKNILITSLSVSFFAFHLATIEPVAWMSGRCDLLVTLFILLGLFLDTFFLYSSKWRLFFFSVCFLLALLSKENAIVYPFMLLAWRYLVEKRETSFFYYLYSSISNKENIPYFLLILSTICIYFGLRWNATEHFIPSTHIHGLDIGNGLNHLLLIGKTFSYYIFLQVLPHSDFSPVYPTFYPVSYYDYVGWLGVLMLICMVVWMVKHARSIWIVGLFTSLIVFLPISNIKPLPAVGNFIHLRFLFLPIVCTTIFILPHCIKSVLEKKSKVFFLFIASIWLLSSILNLKTSVPLWTRESGLWEWAVKMKPTSWVAWNNYAGVLETKKDYSGCVAAAKESIRYFSARPHGYSKLTSCYSALGDIPSARYYANKALALPDKVDRFPFAVLLIELTKMDVKELMSTYHQVKYIPENTKQAVASHLQQAVSLTNGVAGASVWLAVWYLKNERVTESVKLVETLRDKKVSATAILSMMGEPSSYFGATSDEVRDLVEKAYKQ